MLAKALLPDSDDHAAVSAIFEEILGDDEDSDDFVEPTLPLIRRVAIDAKTHTHTWSNNFVPAFLFTVGDIGYIPPGEDFGSFVILGNIIKDGLAILDTAQSSRGFHTRWKPHITRDEIQPFPAHGDYTGYGLRLLLIECTYALYSWPVILNAGERDNLQVIYECSVVSVSTAWQVLLEHAQSIASKNNVKPEDLMLGMLPDNECLLEAVLNLNSHAFWYRSSIRCAGSSSQLPSFAHVLCRSWRPANAVTRFRCAGSQSL